MQSKIFNFPRVKLEEAGYARKAHLHVMTFSYFLFLDLVTGLIHANHGGKIIEYLLQQLKNATTDVRFYSLNKNGYNFIENKRTCYSLLGNFYYLLCCVYLAMQSVHMHVCMCDVCLRFKVIEQTQV